MRIANFAPSNYSQKSSRANRAQNTLAANNTSPSFKSTPIHFDKIDLTPFSERARRAILRLNQALTSDGLSSSVTRQISHLNTLGSRKPGTCFIHTSEIIPGENKPVTSMHEVDLSGELDVEKVLQAANKRHSAALLKECGAVLDQKVCNILQPDRIPAIRRVLY